jgi:integrase
VLRPLPRFSPRMQEWQRNAKPNEGGWMFANESTGKPFHASTIQQDYLWPAGLRIGLGDGLGWHTFRHSYRTLLDATRAPLGVQQRLMRHGGHRNHDERVRRGLYDREARGTRKGRADASTDKGKGHHGNGGLLNQLRSSCLMWGSVELISSKWLRG